MTKTLKTIELTRRIRENHADQMKKKTHTERIAFYRAKAQAFRKQAEAKLQKQMQSENKAS